MAKCVLDSKMISLIISTCCCHLFVDSQFIGSHFKLGSCADPLKSLLPPAVSSPTFTPALSPTMCALSILQDAHQYLAVFHPLTKECQYTTQYTEESFKELAQESPNTEHNTDTTCTVLSKTNDEKTFAEWEKVEVESLSLITHAQFLPLKIMTKAGPRRSYLPATYSLSDSGGSYFALAFEQIGFALWDIKIYLPIYYIFQVFTKVTVSTLTSFTIGGTGDFTSKSVDVKYTFHINVRNDFEGIGNNAGFVTTNSTQWMILGLLQGYRRVQRGPYQSRAVIDVENEDVNFDTTETYVVGKRADMQDPVHVTSVKESVKDGKRYEFYHQVNKGGNSLPHAETEADPFWVLDKSWAKLEPGDGSSQSVLEALKENILEGKEVRLVMGREISTDVTSSMITSEDLIVTLTMYLTPFKGVDSKDATTQFVRFPVLGLRSNTLIECELEYMTDVLTNVHNTTYDSNIDWYVSTRNWTKVLEMAPNDVVLSGSFEVLYEAADEQGKNVRVCVLDVSGNTLCHGALTIITDTDIVVLKSVSMLNAVVGESQTLRGVEGNCERSYRILSSQGLVSSASFVAGVKSSNRDNVLFEKQMWFVEY